MGLRVRCTLRKEQRTWCFRAPSFRKCPVQAWNAANISAWVNRNEVQEREGFNPEPGLDSFLEPLNVGIGE